jgi:cytochrome c
MKKTIFILGCYVLAMAACASPEERAAAIKQAETSATASKVAADGTIEASATDLEEGAKLLAASDCMGCHNKDQKIVGPAYVDVAAKYALNEENVNHLVDKVIKGGSGAWGEIPMSPHESLNIDDAKKMIVYILSLKK